MTQQRGFTLLEVMVALAVLSVALLAGVRAAEALTHRAQLHERQVAAQLCAHNALIALRLRGALPDVGGADSTCEQGPFSFKLYTSVWTTPNPNFRRVVARVQTGEEVDASLSTILGRY
jgi:general secretion pathway protein I